MPHPAAGAEIEKPIIAPRSDGDAGAARERLSTEANSLRQIAGQAVKPPGEENVFSSRAQAASEQLIGNRVAELPKQDIAALNKMGDNSMFGAGYHIDTKDGEPTAIHFYPSTLGRLTGDREVTIKAGRDDSPGESAFNPGE